MCFSLQIDVDLKKLARELKAKAHKPQFEKFYDLRTRYPKKFKRSDENDQIYPNYFCPIISRQGDQNIILPMRYRIRPKGSKEEIPAKYNVFNARMDSLLKRQTWKNIYGKNHCLIPLHKFYEWVEVDSKKRLISFYPKDDEMLVAPGLYDIWYDEEHDFHMHSFAIITTDPNNEVLEMGHDRTPVILKEENYEHWLNPKGREIDDLFSILNNKRPVYFENKFI